MLVVTELDDPFLPMPDDLLVNLHDSKELVDALLDALPAGYSANTSNDSAMGPALQVGQAGKGWKHTLRDRAHLGTVLPSPLSLRQHLSEPHCPLGWLTASRTP
jgi:hypothetical protein